MSDTGPDEKPTLEEAAIDAALKLACERNWDQITLADIADGANTDLGEFYDRLSRDRIVDLIDRKLDKACASEPVDMSDTLRERIFDVIMLRFEAMEEHRPAILSIRKSWKGDPSARLAAAKRRARTARWAWTCAHEDGPGSSARTALLTGILTRAERAWEKEDSADFTRTMSQLDRDLREVSGLAKRVKGMLAKRRASSPEDAEPEVSG